MSRPHKSKAPIAVVRAHPVVPVEAIEQRIYLIRGQKVMLSPDLAALYQVETRALVQAVKRNLDRFPSDFMFQLTQEEYTHLKSQIVISSWGGARRDRPYAFTEHGILMLSTVLRSKRAIQVNIAIMRAFVKIRAALATHKELAREIENLELKYRRHDAQIERHNTDIQEIFEALRQLIEQPVPARRQIGFNPAGAKLPAE